MIDTRICQNSTGLKSTSIYIKAKQTHSRKITNTLDNKVKYNGSSNDKQYDV